MLAVVIAAAIQTQTPPPMVEPLVSTRSTVTGQPLALPQGEVEVTVARVTLQPGGAIPRHRHAWPRYVHVLSGRLQVTNFDTGDVSVLDAGSFLVEAIGQWHMGEALGDAPLILLVIDQAPPGVVNVERP
ncbi:cupin domain-containing protein [Brevundimonas sp.]|uniref:cupin domain-containing protein n=1 Tax=Brevundimonas sp. TaxID=1871086 RepID=UPI0025D8B7CF|nr:cupin domain-containing protein [Brevundimonas sp.]